MGYFQWGGEAVLDLIQASGHDSWPAISTNCHETSRTNNKDALGVLGYVCVKSMLILGIGTILGGAKQYAVWEVLALDQYSPVTALAIVSLSFQGV